MSSKTTSKVVFEFNPTDPNTNDATIKDCSIVKGDGTVITIPAQYFPMTPITENNADGKICFQATPVLNKIKQSFDELYSVGLLVLRKQENAEENKAILQQLKSQISAAAAAAAAANS